MLFIYDIWLKKIDLIKCCKACNFKNKWILKIKFRLHHKRINSISSCLIANDILSLSNPRIHFQEEKNYLLFNYNTIAIPIIIRESILYHKT